jgi:hypothetical protein
MGSMFSSSTSPTILQENPICEKIKGIIQPYIDLARQHPIQKIGIPVHFLEKSSDRKIPVITISGFVNLLNSSLQSSTNFTSPYFASIYKMANVKYICNGIIIIKYVGFQSDGKLIKAEEFKGQKNFKPYFYFKSSEKNIYILVSDIEKDIHVLGKNNIPITGGKRLSDKTEKQPRTISELFTDNFLTQYRDSNCKFISIALSLKPTEGGHSNLLLVYKGHRNIFLILYEPHGAQGVQSSEGPVNQYNQMKSQFINFLTAVINDEEKKSPTPRAVLNRSPNEISPKKGIQSFMQDRNGYCYMISSFWLYILLELINSDVQINLEDFFQNLQSIENCVYSIAAGEIEIDKKMSPKHFVDQTVIKKLKQGSLARYTPPQLLYSIIVHFSYDFLTRFYMSYLRPEASNYDTFLKIYRKIYTKIKEKILIEYIDDTATNLTKDDEDRLKQQSKELLACSSSSSSSNHICSPLEHDDPKSEDEYHEDEHSEAKNQFEPPDIDQIVKDYDGIVIEENYRGEIEPQDIDEFDISSSVKSTHAYVGV